MKSLATIFLNLLTLKAGPHDLPDSKKLLQTILALDVIISLGYLKQVVGWQDAIVHVAIAIGLLAGLIYGLLAFKHLSYRFTQTFTALLGIDLIFTILRWILESLGILSSAFDENIGILSLLSEIGLGLWVLLIQGNVFRHTLNISRLKGCLVAFIVMIIFLVVFSRLGAPETLKDSDPQAETSLEEELEMEELNATPLNHTTGHFKRHLVLCVEDFSLLREGMKANMELMPASTNLGKII